MRSSSEPMSDVQARCVGGSMSRLSAVPLSAVLQSATAYSWTDPPELYSKQPLPSECTHNVH